MRPKDTAQARDRDVLTDAAVSLHRRPGVRYSHPSGSRPAQAG